MALFIINMFFLIMPIFNYIFKFTNDKFVDIDFFIIMMMIDVLNYLKNFLLIILNINNYFKEYIHLFMICP